MQQQRYKIYLYRLYLPNGYNAMPMDTKCVNNLQFWTEKQTKHHIIVHAFYHIHTQFSVKLNGREYTISFFSHTHTKTYTHTNIMWYEHCGRMHKWKTEITAIVTGMCWREQHLKNTKQPPPITLLFKWLYSMISCFSIWCIIYCSTTIGTNASGCYMGCVTFWVACAPPLLLPPYRSKTFWMKIIRLYLM